MNSSSNNLATNIFNDLLSGVETLDSKEVQIISNIHNKVKSVRPIHTDFLLHFKRDLGINMVAEEFFKEDVFRSYYLLGATFGKKKANRIYKLLFSILANHQQKAAELNFLDEEINSIMTFNAFKEKIDLPILSLTGESSYSGMSVEPKQFTLLKNIGYDNYIKFLEMLNTPKLKTNYHDIIENLDRTTIYNLTDEKFCEEFFVAIKKFIESPRLINVLNFINFKRVRLAPTTDKAFAEINLLNLAINKKISLIAQGKEGKHYLLLNESMMFDGLRYTRNSDTIMKIGKITECCFRPDGLAKSLLEPSIKSPLSGIFKGTFRNGSLTWFSFIWEFEEIDSETGMTTVSLVLDNLEANRTLNENEWLSILNYLESQTDYYKIYLGTQRNDIYNGYTDTLKSSQTKEKPHSLVNYQSNFNSYAYDDSRHMYTVVDNSEKPLDEVFITKMDEGWLERASFIEQNFWKDDTDKYFTKTNVNKTPSYIIRGSYGRILGYLTTELSLVNTTLNKLIIQENKKVSKPKDDEEGQSTTDYCLYISDFVLTSPSDKEVLRALPLIFKDLESFIKETKIKYSSASFNKYSKPFKKRLDKITTFIPDERFGNEPLTNTRKTYNHKILKSSVKFILEK